MQPKRKLIVFDIDGTLTDSVDIHQTVFKEALHLLGVNHLNDKFDLYRHHTDFHIAKVNYELDTNKDFDISTSQLFEKYLHSLISNQAIKEITGARKFIKFIEESTEFGICYATGSMLLPAVYKLEQCGIDFQSDLLVGSNGIEEREKIVELAIERALTYYKVENFDKILCFGDGLWDLMTAKNLSLEFIGIGDKNKDVLMKHGMQKHYTDFQGLEADWVQISEMPYR